jgi:hypothetical protein
LWFWNKPKFAALGQKSYLHKGIFITKKYIHCGAMVRVFKNCRIEGITKYQDELFSPQIWLGDDVPIQQNLHLTCAKSIIIGNNTAIAANVTITDIHHLYDDIDTPIEKQKLRVSPVQLGTKVAIYKVMNYESQSKCFEHPNVYLFNSIEELHEAYNAETKENNISFFDKFDREKFINLINKNNLQYKIAN